MKKKRRGGNLTIKLSADEQLRSTRLVFNRLIRSYALYFWVTKVRPMLSEHPSVSAERFAVRNVQNSCVESVLMSVRDLDDFFAPITEKTFEEDLRAADLFNYKTPGSFLSGPDREAINRLIAHLTYAPVRSKTTGALPDAKCFWNTFDQVKKATLAMISFMDYLLSLPSKQISDNAIDEVKVWKRTVLQLAKNMESVAQSELNPHKSPSITQS